MFVLPSARRFLIAFRIVDFFSVSSGQRLGAAVVVRSLLPCRAEILCLLPVLAKPLLGILPSAHARGGIDVFHVVLAVALVVVEIGIVDPVPPLLVSGIGFVRRELGDEEGFRLTAGGGRVRHVIRRRTRLDAAEPVRAAKLLEQGQPAWPAIGEIAGIELLRVGRAVAAHLEVLPVNGRAAFLIDPRRGRLVRTDVDEGREGHQTDLHPVLPVADFIDLEKRFGKVLRRPLERHELVAAHGAGIVEHHDDVEGRLADHGLGFDADIERVVTENGAEKGGQRQRPGHGHRALVH